MQYDRMARILPNGTSREYVKKAMKAEKDIPYVIGIPQGTRLSGLLRVKDAWQVWIAVKDKSANPSQWQGTYLLCHDDGSVLRIQNDIEPEEIFHVKLADR